MSYILEALKKAEAERQLGSAPTIHAAPAVHAAAAAAGSRKPLLIGLAAGVLLASAALFAAWRHQASVAPAAPAAGRGAAQVAPPQGTEPAPLVVAAVEPVGALPIAGGAAPARTPPIVAAAEPAPAVPVVPAARPAQPAPVAPTPASSAPAQARVDTPAPDPAQARVDTPAPGTAQARTGTPAPEPGAAGVPAPARTGARPAVQAGANAPGARAAPHFAAPAAPGVDDNVRPLAELPEAIQREVPRVTFGGYIYSPNPADRLLLVDKALRHEGEEVAPGLVLEKLLPKAAVMNYRGYRYRVAY